MIRIIESSTERLKLKQYPANSWLVFIFLALLSTLAAYHIYFQSPISSSLVCSKDFLNRTNCQLIESALLNHNFTERQIKNVKEPHRKIVGRSNVIWLATDIKIWHRKIQNVYYPSSLFLDPFLYRTNRQVLAEIEKLNRFINSSRNDRTLTIERKVHGLFFVLVWMLILPLLLPIVFILIYPIVTFYFNLETNSLSVTERTSFSTKKNNILFKRFKSNINNRT